MIRKLKLGASVTSFIVAVSAVTVLLIHSGNEAYNNEYIDWPFLDGNRPGAALVEIADSAVDFPTAGLRLDLKPRADDTGESPNLGPIFNATAPLIATELDLDALVLPDPGTVDDVTDGWVMFTPRSSIGGGLAAGQQGPGTLRVNSDFFAGVGGVGRLTVFSTDSPSGDSSDGSSDDSSGGNSDDGSGNAVPFELIDDEDDSTVAAGEIVLFDTPENLDTLTNNQDGNGEDNGASSNYDDLIALIINDDVIDELFGDTNCDVESGALIDCLALIEELLEALDCQASADDLLDCADPIAQLSIRSDPSIDLLSSTASDVSEPTTHLLALPMTFLVLAFKRRAAALKS